MRKLIGEIYREKVLSLSKRSLRKVELEYSPENLRIEKDLFGWKLFYTRFGRKTGYFLECRSEEEARFLKIFFELGLKKIHVPKDEKYLKSILPEFEKEKKRTDEILDFYTDAILNRQIRERVKHEVYMEVLYRGTKEMEEEQK
jgi:hypothetical protein